MENKGFHKPGLSPSILPILLLVAGFLFFPKPAAADVADVMATVLGWIVSPLVSLAGKLIAVIIRLLISVAQYNDFLNSPAVSVGWTIIRDVCNMFFIVILLVIAFCTVLRIEQYSYKRLLGSLIMAAIIVNFSKLICGLIIDFAQVIMLTFVNAFKDAGEGNFATMVGLDQLLAARKDLGTVSGMETVIALILALVLSIVTLVVLLVMTAILFFRIVALWILVAISPFAFVANILPQTARYSNMWWDKFTNQVIVGPVMAFFIWLSLAVVQQTWQSAEEDRYLLSLPKEVREKLKPEELVEGAGGTGLSAAVSKMGQSRYILNFVVGIAMLIGSLMAAQQLGVAGSQMAGKAIGKMQGWAQGTAKFPLKKLAPYAIAGWGAVKGAAAAGFKGTWTAMVKGAEKIPGVGKGVQVIEKVPAKIRKIKADIIGSLEEKAKERAERISQGKASFWDYVQQSMYEAYQKTGWKDRDVLNAAQVKSIQEIQKRLTLQSYSEDQLRALATIGKGNEKIAALLLLMQRGLIKKNDDNLIQGVRHAIIDNNFLRGNFDNLIKKTAHPDTAASIIYNNFQTAVNVEQFLQDLKEEKIKGEFLAKLDSQILNNIEKVVGGKNKLGQVFLDKLSNKELAEIRSAMEKIGEQKRLDDWFNKINTKRFKNNQELEKFVIASGRVDLIQDHSIFNQFLKRYKNIVRDSINDIALQDQKLVDKLMNALDQKVLLKQDIDTILQDPKKKQALKQGLNAYVQTLNNDTSNKANIARDIYLQITKGIDFDKTILNGLQVPVALQNYLQHLLDEIRKGNLNPDVVSQLNTQNTNVIQGFANLAQNYPTLFKTIIIGMNRNFTKAIGQQINSINPQLHQQLQYDPIIRLLI